MQNLIPRVARGLSIGGGFSMRGQFVGGACGGLDDVLPSVQSKIRLWMRNKADTWNWPTEKGKQAHRCRSGYCSLARACVRNI